MRNHRGRLGRVKVATAHTIQLPEIRGLATISGLDRTLTNQPEQNSRAGPDDDEQAHKLRLVKPRLVITLIGFTFPDSWRVLRKTVILYFIDLSAQPNANHEDTAWEHNFLERAQIIREIKPQANVAFGGELKPFQTKLDCPDSTNYNNQC